MATTAIGDEVDGIIRLRCIKGGVAEPRYTLAEIATLVQRYVIEVSEPNSMVDWRMSDFLLWFARQEAKREQGKESGGEG